MSQRNYKDTRGFLPRRPQYTTAEVAQQNYDKQYEYAKENISTYKKQTAPYKKQGPSRKSHNEQRTAQMRVTKGKEAMRSISEGLDAKIGVSLKELDDALNQIEANKTLVAITTIVSTRCIGFSACTMFRQAMTKRNPVLCTIYSYFRVTLAMVDVRLMEIRSTLKAPYQNQDMITNLEINPQLERTVKTINAYPVAIGKIINAIGPIEEGDEYFIPAFPAKRESREGQLIPLPGEVRFGNLREVVERLSDQHLNPLVRQNFYAHNSIPGCIWRGGPHNPVLANADEIMPANYTIVDLQDDIREFNYMHAWMQQKLPKFVNTTRINYESPGEKSLLMCNNEETLRYIDRNPGEELNAYYTRLKLSGDINDFWSQRNLKKPDMLHGQMNLLGEVPSVPNYRYPNYICRDIQLAGWKYDTSWKGVEQILYN